MSQPKVGQPRANTKATQKSLSFLKRMWSAVRLCRAADNVIWRLYMCIIHVRVIIFCTYNQTTFIINNIKNVFN